MSPKIRRHLAVLAATCALSLVAAAAHAGDSAQKFIEARQGQVTNLLHQPPGATRDKQIQGVLDGMLDYDQLARRSLAQHWGDLSDAQKKDFTDVLRQLVQRNYEKNIKNIQDYNVEFLGEDPGTEGVVVHTRAASKTNQREDPVSIDYRMFEEGGNWHVFDIVTEGSSLVNNYKNQFHRIIQKDGFDALLKRMKDKIAKGQGAM